MDLNIFSNDITSFPKIIRSGCLIRCFGLKINTYESKIQFQGWAVNVEGSEINKKSFLVIDKLTNVTGAEKRLPPVEVMSGPVLYTVNENPLNRWKGRRKEQSISIDDQKYCCVCNDSAYYIPCTEPEDFQLIKEYTKLSYEHFLNRTMSMESQYFPLQTVFDRICAGVTLNSPANRQSNNEPPPVTFDTVCMVMYIRDDYDANRLILYVVDGSELLNDRDGQRPTTSRPNIPVGPATLQEIHSKTMAALTNASGFRDCADFTAMQKLVNENDQLYTDNMTPNAGGQLQRSPPLPLSPRVRPFKIMCLDENDCECIRRAEVTEGTWLRIRNVHTNLQLSGSTCSSTEIADLHVGSIIISEQSAVQVLRPCFKYVVIHIQWC